MGVHDPVEALEERGPQQVHVARADDERHAVPDEPVGHGRVSLLAALVVVELEDGRRDAGRCGPLERPRAGLVRRDRRDGQPRVDQRLQVRALARDEHADHVTRPITSPAPASAAGTTAHIPIPTLNTRRCSSSLTPCSVSHA